MTFIALVNEPYFNVKQYGALGDGATDDTAAITAALAAASAAGGGTVYYPPGVYITGPQTLSDYVIQQGSGIKATTIRLKAASNTHLFKGTVNGYGGGVMVDITASHLTGSNSGNVGFGFRDLTLDGNRTNQSSGPSWVLYFYGYDYILQNMYIYNGYSGGMYADWNGTSSSVATLGNIEAQLVNVKAFTNGGTGIKFAGPSDSDFTNVQSYRADGHGFHIGPNALGLNVVNCHGYSVNNAGGKTCASFLVESQSCLFTNCVAEGSDTMEVALLGNYNTWIGGRIFDPNAVSNGLQLGQAAGNTPFFEQVNQAAGVTTAVTVQYNTVQTLITACNGANGAIFFANSGGINMIEAMCQQTSGNYTTGTIHSIDELNIRGFGLTADGTIAKGGGVKWAVTADQALLVRDMASAAVFNIASRTGQRRIELASGTLLRLYSDSFVTRTVELSGGTISLLQSTTAAGITNGNTITTSGVGVARVAPAGAVTAIVLQAGTLPGQTVMVVNESAFTITMDISGTSHVADGTSDVIAANTARKYVWDGGTSLWYRCA